MTCDTVREQLNALADSELTPWAAGRARRHLAHCPGCAAEFAAIQRLSARVRSWRAVSAPASLPFSAMPPPQRVRRTWRPALALAGCAGIVAAVALFLPGQPARPTITFADVEKAMGQVNVIGYMHTETLYQESFYTHRVTYKAAIKEWERRSPPAMAAIGQIAASAHSPRSFQTLWTDAKSVYFDRIRPVYTVKLPSSKAYARPDAAVTESFDFFTSPLRSAMSLGPWDVSPEQPSESPTPERAQLNGRDAWKFVRLLRHYGNNRGLPLSLKAGTADVETIWVDPKSARILQVEMDLIAGNRCWGVITDKDFRYGSAPLETFELRPPPGAHIKIVK